MSFDTMNPVPSTDARDFIDNIENFDAALNKFDDTWEDRNGVARDTFEGRLKKGSYYRVGTFAGGYTLTNSRQTLAYGQVEYSWSGAFPKVVAAATTPETTGGIGAGAWVDRTDVTLRLEINKIWRQFNCIADIDGNVSLGEKISVENYYLDGRSGNLFFTVVAAGTGTHDGGKYIDMPISNLQLAQNIKKPYNPMAWGAKLDGVTDDTSKIQATINYFSPSPENSSLSINRQFTTDSIESNGVAAVSSSIQLKNSVNINFLCLKALPSFADGDVILETDGTDYYGSINELIIDGNNQDVYGCVVSRVYRTRINYLTVVNCKRDSFTSNAPGYELFLNNFQLIQSPDCSATAIGLNINSGDGHYSNGVCSFNPIGTKVSGGSNVFDKIHCWSGYYANGKDAGFSGGREQRVGFWINASNNCFSNCQSDSPSRNDYSQSGEVVLTDGLPNGGIGFYMPTAAFRNKLTSCSLVINSTLYQSAALVDSRPAASTITPWHMAGKDNSVIGFRCENKTELTSPTYTTTAIKFANAVIGSDNVQNILHSRLGFPAVSANTEAGLSIKLYDVLYGGVSVGSLEAPNNFTLSVRGVDQLHLNVDNNSVAGLRLYGGGGTQRLEPKNDGLTNLAAASFRFANVFLVNAPVVGSDKRIKTEVTDIPDALLDFVISTPIKQYKRVDGDRYHYGIIIDESLISSIDSLMGVDNFAPLCHDLFVDDDGNPITKSIGDVELGDLWQVRYDEWQNILLEGIRRKLIC